MGVLCSLFTEELTVPRFGSYFSSIFILHEAGKPRLICNSYLLVKESFTLQKRYRQLSIFAITTCGFAPENVPCSFHLTESALDFREPDAELSETMLSKSNFASFHLNPLPTVNVSSCFDSPRPGVLGRLGRFS